MSDLITSPVKLKFRGDTQAGLIRASFAMTDGSQEFVVSTLNMIIAEQDKAAYEVWKSALIEIHTRWVERVAGVKVIRIDSYTVHESN